MSTSTTVEIQETPSIKIYNFLVSKGLTPASFKGIAMERQQDSDFFIGVLRDNPAKQPLTKRYFFNLLSKTESKSRRDYIGLIWFNSVLYPNIKPSSHWLFEVIGREHVEFATQLAEEMAQRFNVKLTVLLKQEKSEDETFYSDRSNEWPD